MFVFHLLEMSVSLRYDIWSYINQYQVFNLWLVPTRWNYFPIYLEVFSAKTMIKIEKYRDKLAALKWLWLHKQRSMQLVQIII